MPAHLHPGASLMEALSWGWCAADDELLDRAYRFRTWAHMHTWEAIRWRQKLRQAKYSPLRGQRWAAVELIVEDREEVAKLSAPAPVAVPVRLIQHHPPALELLPPVKAGLPPEYEEWKANNINGAALAEVMGLAPARAKEALDLEARAKQATTWDSINILLKRAAGIWAALLNIKEPALWK